MLVDISFWDWERMKAESASTEVNPHDMQEDFVREYWEKWMSPEALSASRIQQGVYQNPAIDNQLNHWSDWEVVNHYAPYDSMESFQEALANGLATCWFGRAVSVEEVLEHLSPTINQEGKTFVLGVSYYPSDEGIDKPHKMGYPIDEALFYEREDTSFWTFHLLEVRKRKGKFPAEVSTEDTT